MASIEHNSQSIRTQDSSRWNNSQNLIEGAGKGNSLKRFRGGLSRTDTTIYSRSEWMQSIDGGTEEMPSRFSDVLAGTTAKHSVATTEADGVGSVYASTNGALDDATVILPENSQRYESPDNQKDGVLSTVVRDLQRSESNRAASISLYSDSKVSNTSSTNMSSSQLHSENVDVAGDVSKVAAKMTYRSQRHRHQGIQHVSTDRSGKDNRTILGVRPSSSSPTRAMALRALIDRLVDQVQVLQRVNGKKGLPGESKTIRMNLFGRSNRPMTITMKKSQGRVSVEITLSTAEDLASFSDLKPLLIERLASVGDIDLQIGHQKSDEQFAGDTRHQSRQNEKNRDQSTSPDTLSQGDNSRESHVGGDNRSANSHVESTLYRNNVY